MPTVPARVYDRLVSGLKKFQPILAAAKARDAGESDTSTIVKDILADVFGYDKYSEITSEYVIKATYCDLAIKIEGKLQILIEVKAVGLDLKDSHTKQACDYGANQGAEWIILTNGVTWRIYRIIFAQPISQDLVFECDFTGVNTKNRSQMECLFLFAKEGQSKSVLQDFHTQRQAMSRYLLGALMVSDPIIDATRRELRRAFPDVKIDTEELRSALTHDVLKREVIEGEKADEARKRLSRAQGRVLRAKAKAAEPDAVVTADGPLSA